MLIGVERRGILPEVVPCKERNRETDCPQFVVVSTLSRAGTAGPVARF